MSTIKISQLGSVAEFTSETIIPVVANISGTLTTLKSDGDTVRTFVLGTLETDLANSEANVLTLQGQVVTLTANAGLQSAAISNIEANIASLSTVATTGSYDDLVDTPELAEVAITGSYDDLVNTPNLATVATTGSYDDLVDTPELAEVAITGSYDDLVNTPNLATVAITGSYDDLVNTPNLATVAITGSYDDLVNTPELAEVAISGDYTDLINSPNLAAIGDFIMGNVDHWTSNVFTFEDAINQLAERIYNIENPPE
jgi:hypothetical protein